MYSYGSPHMAAQKQDDQHERTFSSYVRIRDVVLKTYLGRWTIGRSGERGSGISVLLYSSSSYGKWYDRLATLNYIHTFRRSIRAKWNINSFVQDFEIRSLVLSPMKITVTLSTPIAWLEVYLFIVDTI